MCTPITGAELAAATSGYAAGALLGRGATGEVFSGALRGAPIAVKRLKAPADASPAVLAALRRRFRAELLTLSTFQHPRIVRLLHACEDTGDAAHPLALAFELLAGGSLADWLRGADGRAGARGALSPLQRIDAALGVAHGLKYLHGLREPGEGGAQAPVVHRDVKSANVGFALAGGGGELYAKVIDCVSSLLQSDLPSPSSTPPPLHPSLTCAPHPPVSPPNPTGPGQGHARRWRCCWRRRRRRRRRLLLRGRAGHARLHGARAGRRRLHRGL